MKKAVIEVHYDPETRRASVHLDGRETQSEEIDSEEQFVEFLQEATADYWWWIGEAWRGWFPEEEE